MTDAPRTDECQGSDGTLRECDELAELCRQLERDPTDAKREREELKDALNMATQGKYSELMLKLAGEVSDRRADKLELAAAIRSLQGQLEAELKARDEAEQDVYKVMDKSAVFRERAEAAEAKLREVEANRQYHMNAINRLAKFLAFWGSSDDIIKAAKDNLTRLTSERQHAEAKEKNND